MTRLAAIFTDCFTTELQTGVGLHNYHLGRQRTSRDHTVSPYAATAPHSVASYFMDFTKNVILFTNRALAMAAKPDEVKKVEIKEIQRKEKRIAAHSHIKGLGLNEDGTANLNAAGLVGQVQAREVIR